MALARGVSAMLRDDWDDLEGDFQRYFGLNLVECAHGPHAIGLRRLKALIEALPPESATARHRGWWWTEGDEQGATQAELLTDVARSLRVLVNQQIPKGQRRFDPPMPRWQRPHVQVEPEPQRDAKPPLSRESVRSMFLQGG
jgi:hypothetical protein